MTALATGIALIPLALGGGEPGSEIQAPMAIVILFGLFTSTALKYAGHSCVVFTFWIDADYIQ
jgi:multidrug efflux pump subunit AcrB